MLVRIVNLKLVSHTFLSSIFWLCIILATATKNKKTRKKKSKKIERNGEAAEENVRLGAPFCRYNL